VRCGLWEWHILSWNTSRLLVQSEAGARAGEAIGGPCVCAVCRMGVLFGLTAGVLFSMSGLPVPGGARGVCGQRGAEPAPRGGVPGGPLQGVRAASHAPAGERPHPHLLGAHDRQQRHAARGKPRAGQELALAGPCLGNLCGGNVLRQA
jgi:hypothetical protein